MFETKIIDRMAYLIRYPEGYTEGKKYPVVFLFHGSGSRGTNINAIKNNCFFEISYSHGYDFITVAPQCHEDSWVELWGNVKLLVDEISCSDFCDRSRIYAMGPSMGGYAVWQIAMSMPHIFAAIVPMCAGGMYWNAERIKNIPVWAFHGLKDKLIDLHDSEKMVNAVNACGGNAKLTVYPELEHEIWRETYTDKRVFEWLFAQSKRL